MKIICEGTEQVRFDVFTAMGFWTDFTEYRTDFCDATELDTELLTKCCDRCCIRYLHYTFVHKTFSNNEVCVDLVLNFKCYIVAESTAPCPNVIYLKYIGIML